jgi:hypothetical protein
VPLAARPHGESVRLYEHVSTSTYTLEQLDV